MRGAVVVGILVERDLRGALDLSLFDIVFAFLFVNLFDNIGTLVGVVKRAGLMDEDKNIPRIGKILTTDAVATMVSTDRCGMPP